MNNDKTSNIKIIIIIVATLIVAFILAFAGKMIYDNVKENKKSDYSDDYLYTDTTADETESTVDDTVSESKATGILNYSTKVETLSDYGTCTYEKITFTGTYDGISKINEAVNEKYTEFCDGVDGEDGYNADAEYGRQCGYNVGQFYYTWKVSSVWHSDKYVSVRFDYALATIGAHGIYTTYGETYDLDTGEKVNLSDLSFTDSWDDTESVAEEYITDYFNNKIDEAEDENEAGNEKAALNAALDAVSKNVDDFTYYIGSDGLHLIFNYYQMSTYNNALSDVVIPLSDFELGTY